MSVHCQNKVISCTTVFVVVVRAEDNRSVVKEIVNPCLTSPCAQQQRCDVIGDTYQCLNVDPCASSPCAQYQRCDVIGRNFRCTDPDPCASSPCADNERCDVKGDPIRARGNAEPRQNGAVRHSDVISCCGMCEHVCVELCASETRWEVREHGVL